VAFDMTATMQAIQSHLLTQGHFDEVKIGDIKNPPSSNLTAHVSMIGATVQELTMTATIELHEISVRLLRHLNQEPVFEREVELAQAFSRYVQTISENVTLGGNVQTVDVAGIYGGELDGQILRFDIGGQPYIGIDSVLAVIVNDVHTLSA
jgi:hypothetical protein